jgi:K+-sensing histidine kinase KdpD
LLLEEAEGLSPAEMQELLGSVRLSVVNLRTLIDNLLESTSIEAGRFAIRRRSVALNEVVAQAIRVVQPLLVRRQQSLALAEPTALPSISADPIRLVQVLVNILSNASKYSPPGTSIDLRIGSQDDALRVAIADQGPGIPEAERANLFRRFMRLDTPVEEQYGVGLGLAVSKAIIEGHGGQIGVEGRPGGGSVFWFTLPAEQAGDDESPDR